MSLPHRGDFEAARLTPVSATILILATYGLENRNPIRYRNPTAIFRCVVGYADLLRSP
jgi:hypothetical protein